jgi:hypothetical protein
MDFSKVSVYSDPDFSYNSFAEPVVFLLSMQWKPVRNVVANESEQDF